MPEPITHGEFTKWLYSTRQLPLDLGAIVRKTHGGVIPEGGYLDERQLAREWIDNHDPSRPRTVTEPITNAKEFVPAGFVFGKSSEKELVGVDERLVKVTRLALELSTQDFIVFDGLRTKAEQAALKKAGKSQTLHSRHLYGLAVDLVPYIDGRPKWDWEGCAKIAFAMDQAATVMGFSTLITWGGAWDRTLGDFGGELSLYMAEVEAYKKRHAGPDFIDGPHFQIEKR
jgi:peptidoglycan L-alanyl-D-glutamate endopeptidase CwlK